jgi:hypothetical protein
MTTRARNSTRRASTFLLWCVVLAGCNASTRRVPASGDLTGAWRGSAAGVTVVLSLVQSGDSVKGSGTYTVAASNTLGCGGGTLPVSGTLTMIGRVQGSSFDGGMKFDVNWDPPYSGTVSGAATLDGHFMSVDAGPCPFALVRQQ